MTDEPKTKTDQVRSQEPRTRSGGSSSRDSQPTSPSPSSTFGDPAPREFGDKPDDAPKATGSPKTDDKSSNRDDPRSGGYSDEDAGEGHKGPRVTA